VEHLVVQIKEEFVLEGSEILGIGLQ